MQTRFAGGFAEGTPWTTFRPVNALRSMGSREDAWDTSDAGNEDMVIRAPFVSAGTGKGEGQGPRKFRYAVSLPTLRLLQQWTVVGAYGARARAALAQS